ncbi:MAG: hypothetical protein ACUZ8I_14280 [Candidatus Scalindua sp.]
MLKEKPAINIIDECADVYYGNLMNVPEDIRLSLSCYQLREIFEHMVKPAIDKARNLDRKS